MEPTQPTSFYPPSQPTPSPIQPPPVRSASTPFLLIILLCVICLFIGFGGGYYVRDMQVASLAAKVPSPTPTQIPPTPTPDETAAWKVYTDPVNHYSIKYPPTMYIIPLDSSDPSSAGGFSVTTKPNATTWLDADPSNQPYYQIEVAADPASKDTLDSMAATFDQYKTRPDYTRTIYTLDGVQGFKVTNISLDSLTDAVYVFKDGVQYSVGYRRFDKAIDTEGQVIFNKILSTFKFTN